MMVSPEERPLRCADDLIDALLGLPVGAASLSSLKAVARRVRLDAEARAALRRPDPARPYGRRVLYADARVECMVATWTPGMRCAVHDHGGASGVIQVLEGRGENLLYCANQGLRLLSEHATSAGDLITGGPRMLHAMGCRSAPGDASLLTLHLYTPTIPHMIVYDVDETLVVDGGCGAWVPHDAPELVLARRPGHWSRAALEADGIIAPIGAS